MAHASASLVATCRRCRTLERENARLQRDAERMKARIAQLEGALERARRDGKRQAAPFSKGEPRKQPRRPGRKPGQEHGPSAWRQPPDHVDEVVAVALPERCPHCDGSVEPVRTAEPFQAELPEVKPHVTRFDIEIGRCRDCGRRVQGRHERRTSDALGAAASQVGPRAKALSAHLNKGVGASYEKVQKLYDVACGLHLTRRALCRATDRLARSAEPTYQALVEHVRAAPVVAPDETGWKVSGHLEWLWAFVTPTVTVYAIQSGRGYDQAVAVLGEDYAGTLARDGWAPYRKFVLAEHQTCLAHLDRRCSELLETAQRGAARVPHAVQRILHRALDLRDRRDAGTITDHGLLVAVGRLHSDFDRLLESQPAVDANRRLVAHLRKERQAMFTFLADPDVPATNWPAEQAIRPAVVTRKICGGNRTWNGARTQQVIASVLRTCRQQHRDPFALFSDVLRAPAPTVARILVEAPRGPPVTFNSS
jgi:transposase